VALHLETDPIDVQIDADGDVTIEKGDFVLTTGLAAIAQAVKLRLQTVRGEWVLDLDEGVPLLEGNGVDASEALFSAPFDEDAWRRAYRDEALEVDGVVDVTGLDVAVDELTREVSVAMVLKTAFGDTPVAVIS
jgi:hypothetical protein